MKTLQEWRYDIKKTVKEKETNSTFDLHMGNFPLFAVKGGEGSGNWDHYIDLFRSQYKFRLTVNHLKRYLHCAKTVSLR